MNNQVAIHTAYDGTLTFKNPLNNKVLGYAGWAGFIASIVHSQGWKAFGSPSQQGGYFIAMPAPHTPEELPIDPGFDGWHKIELDELLDFVDGDESAVH